MTSRIALAALLLLLACGKKEAESDQKETPTKAPVPPSWTKDLTRDCPAYAKGATVTVDDTADGLRVTITGPADVVEEIRRNAHYVEGAAAAGAGASALDFGGGPTGNRNANCPVVLDDTTVVVADVAGGVTVDVAPRSPANLDALRKTARERLETLTILREAMAH